MAVTFVSRLSRALSNVSLYPVMNKYVVWRYEHFGGDLYVLLWLSLLVAFIVLIHYDVLSPTLLAWFAFYRMLDILASRIHQIVNIIGDPREQWTLAMSRREVVLSGVNVLQVVLAFSVIYMGWAAEAFGSHHQIGYFIYHSMLIAFVVGIPDLDQNLSLIVGALIALELATALSTLVLGLGGFLTEVHSTGGGPSDPVKANDSAGKLAGS
jgi:hypothetical protein